MDPKCSTAQTYCTRARLEVALALGAVASSRAAKALTVTVAPSAMHHVLTATVEQLDQRGIAEWRAVAPAIATAGLAADALWDCVSEGLITHGPERGHLRITPKGWERLDQ